ncbi:MAG: polysaccharide deacetylase family protein [Hyphomonas oceanitis]|uniref:polysaccharide deacetylase family protein n=1 Tax=Hyphomonas oceanitis TaxID=81033 RepID=UPI003001A9AE
MKTALKQALKSAGVTRLAVASSRMCCERHLIAALGRARRRYIGRILCYHSIGQSQWGVNDVTPAQFRRQIERALDAGFKFVPASQIVETGGGPKDLAITFDDGLRSVLTNAAPIMKEYNLPWTIFPVSEWSDGRHWTDDNVILTWDEIETLLSMGAEMGSHSATHSDFGQMGHDQIVDELAGSRDMFERRIGIKPDTFAIPFGQSANWTPEAGEIAKAAGYKVIFAQAEDTRPENTIPRTFVTKFDGDFIFNALLKGKFDRWEEWV